MPQIQFAQFDNGTIRYLADYTTGGNGRLQSITCINGGDHDAYGSVQVPQANGTYLTVGRTFPVGTTVQNVGGTVRARVTSAPDPDYPNQTISWLQILNPATTQWEDLQYANSY